MSTRTKENRAGHLTAFALYAEDPAPYRAEGAQMLPLYRIEPTRTGRMPAHGKALVGRVKREFGECHVFEQRYDEHNSIVETRA